MNRRALVVGSLRFALTCLAARAQAARPVRTLAKGELRIGTYFINPPFEYVSNGIGIGFEVDLMNEVARRLGLQPLFENTQWEMILQVPI